MICKSQIRLKRICPVGKRGANMTTGTYITREQKIAYP